MRFLPLIWKKKTDSAFFGEFLDHAASALLAALFVTAFVEFPFQAHSLEIKSLALLPVLFSYFRWKNLGLSVVLGVLAHFILSQFT
ncbi:MAG: AzlD domain-containing protein [Candidatus Atribacteria bacterium]|nr:AzlD domain-containing protein [Candidatus Atribacteria bacterium]